jgi:hypothetical protein
MIKMSQFLRVLCIASISMLIGACTTTYATRDLSNKETRLDQATSQVSKSVPLSVRVLTFDPGTLPKDKNLAKGLSKDIRNAESHFFAVQLKNTMQRSGHWGPIRVSPKGARDGEVTVKGIIIESDGELLNLKISVVDARGAKWFTKDYESVINDNVYAQADSQRIEPFQNLYNDIANDIAIHQKKLKSTDITKIRKVSELRFGADFAPGIFNKYINKRPESPQNEPLEKLVSFFKGYTDASFLKGYADVSLPAGKYSYSRLPSDKDPLVRRVIRIRSREDFLIDTLDQQYDDLSRKIVDVYTLWRRSRLKEINAIREAESANNKQQAEAVAIGVMGVLVGVALSSNNNCYSCASTGGAIAGAAVAVAVQKAVQASKQAESEARMRQTALEELGDSLKTDVRPVVIEVEGETVKLTGTVEEKFEKWRKVLKEIRQKEIGDIPATSPTPEKRI